MEKDAIMKAIIGKKLIVLSKSEEGRKTKYILSTIKVIDEHPCGAIQQIENVSIFTHYQKASEAFRNLVKEANDEVKKGSDKNDAWKSQPFPLKKKLQ